MNIKRHRGLLLRLLIERHFVMKGCTCCKLRVNPNSRSLTKNPGRVSPVFVNWRSGFRYEAAEISKQKLETHGI